MLEKIEELTLAGVHEHIRFRLHRHDELIKLEFDLVGYRMTWLMTSQSFFFAAFALCAVSPIGKDNLIFIVGALLITIPIIGMLSAGLVAVAIHAAHKEIVILKDSRATVELEASRFQYEKLGVDKGSSVHSSGNWPSQWLPPLLAAAWLGGLVIITIDLLRKFGPGLSH